jgi:hypothetical protein
VPRHAGTFTARLQNLWRIFQAKKKTRQLLTRFRKQRGWISEDTKINFTDKQVVRRAMCLHKPVTENTCRNILLVAHSMLYTKFKAMLPI